nr:hypothetical protein [uncultured Rhodoferax sp.]
MITAHKVQHCETMAEVRSHIDAHHAAYRALMDAMIAFEHLEFARLREGVAA